MKKSKDKIDPTAVTIGEFDLTKQPYIGQIVHLIERSLDGKPSNSLEAQLLVSPAMILGKNEEGNFRLAAWEYHLLETSSRTFGNVKYSARVETDKNWYHNWHFITDCRGSCGMLG